MKKLLSILLVLVVSLSVLTVSADNVTLRNPVQCDLVLGSDSYVTTVKDSNGVITGRTIDASKASSTTLASTKNGSYPFKYRAFSVSDSGTYTFGGASFHLKTNFIWEFDFSLSGTIPTEIDNCLLQFQSWSNKIYFVALDDTHYYIRWNTVPDVCLNEPEVTASTLDSKYVLEEGKTYRMKIEADYNADKVYITLTNPYLDSEGNVKEEADWNNAFSRTTTSKKTLGFSITSADDAKNTADSYRFGIVLQDKTKGTVFNMSNETFYMDRIFAAVPELSVSANSVTATATAINIPDYGYYGKLPSVLCAVYQDNKLIDLAVNSPYVSGLRALTDSEYSASVENLADGTYTVRAFVWNAVDKMLAYDNCRVEKTLTVTDGVATLGE